MQVPCNQSSFCSLSPTHWCLQGLSKRGMDVAFLGTGSSVLAVGGLDASGANIAIWDTQAPSYHRPVARLNHHSAAVTSLQVRARLRSLPHARQGMTIAEKILPLAGQAPSCLQCSKQGSALCMLSSACDA